MPLPIEKVYGIAPPVTVIGPLLNGTPTSPVLLAAQVTDRGGLMAIMQAVPTPPKESVTCTVKAPGAVGVPVTSPVEGFRVSPAGSGPLPIEKVYGAVPPVTVIAPLSKGTPTVPVFTAAQVTARDPLMVIMQLVLELPNASVTSTVEVPDAVGVPVTSPVLSASQVTERGPLMVIMQLVLVMPRASVTSTVKVPAAVGVPVTAPVEVSSISP